MRRTRPNDCRGGTGGESRLGRSLRTKVGAWLKLHAVALLAIPATIAAAQACNAPVSACGNASRGSLAIVRGGTPAAIYVDASADPALLRVASSFAADLERVSKVKPRVLHDLTHAKGEIVIIGVLGQSPAIDGLSDPESSTSAIWPAAGKAIASW